MVWDLRVWENQFAGLLDKYEAAPQGSADGRSIEERILSDWDIFSFTERARVRAFLEDVFVEPHPLLRPGVLVRPRSNPGDLDHVGVWDSYVNHLKLVNRFFPPNDLPDDALNLLGELILANGRKVEVGKSYFRGRPTADPQPFALDNMGMPPAATAPGGRGNPIGIPHLYIASDVETCAAECRVGLNGYVSIATFRVEAELNVLDLAVVDSINPFTTERDVSSYLQARAFLSRLRDEISKPARSTDAQRDYVSTQFLCEYAKHLGLHGVMYPSTLKDGGTNLVLFTADRVAGDAEVKTFVVVRDELRMKLLN
ncbi:RES family NAD+ phosphorylase [Arthrobacter sp. AK01]|uniref:RES family NAD+ phosphorylase n=1 Tax=Arthrobacter sp. AK01 TaxID=2894084 RepID=UPI001E621C8A|nr:RES family NAD+ phosphorylase [Arthrobacter sp. AK01]MCD4852425.1 RES family NAD+ phosphorylase [Arthrobacter sp. AK01]